MKIHASFRAELACFRGFVSIHIDTYLNMLYIYIYIYAISMLIYICKFATTVCILKCSYFTEVPGKAHVIAQLNAATKAD